MSTLLLVDAYSQIYRAFYAIRHLTSPTGQPVNALYGFTKMLRKLIADHRPTHVGVVFDLGAPRHRLALLPSYKEQRPPTPPDLESQLPAIRTMLAALGLPVIESDGEEADDLIATLATQANQSGARVLIASNDKDFMQLVNDNVLLVGADVGETGLLNPAGVVAKCGVAPSQVVDYLCLIGDSVDNVPGVPGIGPKTAVELLRKFGSVTELLARLPEVQRPKLRETLEQHRERLQQNRKLIALHTNSPVGRFWDGLIPQPVDLPRTRELCRAYGFRTLLADLERAAAPQTGDLFAGGY